MVFEARDYPFHPERLRAIIRGFGDYVPDAGAEGEAKAAEDAKRKARQNQVSD